jgi:hypothetical protein
VREPGELKQEGKIPRAINLPLSGLQETLSLPEGAFQEKFEFAKPEKDKVYPGRWWLTVRKWFSIAKQEFEAPKHQWLQKKQDMQSIFPFFVNSRIGNYKGSFDDWVARFLLTPRVPLINSKGTVAKAA